MTPEAPRQDPSEPPLMIYDGDCDFCRRQVQRWQRLTGEEVRYLPYQDPEARRRLPSIPEEAFSKSVHLLEADGRIRTGAAAALGCLRHGGLRWPWWCYGHIPGAGWVAEWGYRWVAAHRGWLSRMTR